MRRLVFAFCVLVMIPYIVVNRSPVGHAQSPQSVHVYSVAVPYPNSSSTTQVQGRVVAFSCTSTDKGGTQCFVASAD
jgi:hypothetical protein